jgi:hypothetical protein
MGPTVELMGVYRTPLLGPKTPPPIDVDTSQGWFTEKQGKEIVQAHFEFFGEGLARRIGFLLGFDAVLIAEGQLQLIISNHPSVLWQAPGYPFSEKVRLKPPAVKGERAAQQSKLTREFLMGLVQIQNDLAELQQQLTAGRDR